MRHPRLFSVLFIYMDKQNKGAYERPPSEKPICDCVCLSFQICFKFMLIHLKKPPKILGFMAILTFNQRLLIYLSIVMIPEPESPQPPLADEPHPTSACYRVQQNIQLVFCLKKHP